MARAYTRTDALSDQTRERRNTIIAASAISLAGILLSSSGFAKYLPPTLLFFLSALVPAAALAIVCAGQLKFRWLENEREKERLRRGGAKVLGSPPDRAAFHDALLDARKRGKVMLDKYLVGFELDSGKPIWVTDDEICSHAAVFAKTGFGKTLWLEGLMFQQMARGRASGFTFIDAKRDPGTLADIIMMALITGRIEDLIVVDPFDPVCAYNFVFTTQRADVKARKVLRCGLPPTSDASTTKHYDRLAADAVYRVVRAMESLGLAWSVRDIAVALSAFNFAYPRMRSLLHEAGSKQAMVELGHLAGSYRTMKGGLDSARLTDNLRGIASELHSISNSEAGEMFCTPRADLSLTDSILRGKCIYYMLPRLEEAESAARMVKVFREDLEVSIGEVTSSRIHKLEDPHLVIIDEGASTFGPTWANLFELARKGRFALMFGAQSVGGLMDQTMGLSEEFYERVMANVNLKVIMRVGDNRTAEDMSEWIGMIKTSKKTLSTGLSSSISAREYTKHIEINKKAADAFRDGITVAEDEEELVSPEELKHEMSAEKGLAWFDKGDGIVRKGRSIWFDSDLPGTWEGREFLTKYESVEADEIGLAEWVDEHIFSIEEADVERENERTGAPGENPPPTNANTGVFPPMPGADPTREEPEDTGPFRLNLLRPFRGKNRANTMVVKSEAPAAEPQPPVAATPPPPTTPAAPATPIAKEGKPPLNPQGASGRNNSAMKSGSGSANNAAQNQPTQNRPQPNRQAQGNAGQQSANSSAHSPKSPNHDSSQRRDSNDRSARPPSPPQHGSKPQGNQRYEAQNRPNEPQQGGSTTPPPQESAPKEGGSKDGEKPFSLRKTKRDTVVKAHKGR